MEVENRALQEWLGGGFKYFFIFTPTWGNDPIWLIFSDGLKPQTRWVSFELWMIFLLPTHDAWIHPRMNPNTETQPENGNATMAWKQGSVANSPPPQKKQKLKYDQLKKKHQSVFFFWKMFIFFHIRNFSHGWFLQRSLAILDPLEVHPWDGSGDAGSPMWSKSTSQGSCSVMLDGELLSAWSFYMVKLGQTQIF